MDPTLPTDDFGDEWDGPELERRVCPNCRLYFDVGAESDAVFCSDACRRRHESGELIADGGSEQHTEEVSRDPKDARIQKLEERNDDLRSAVEEVRELLEPYDLTENPLTIEISPRQRERFDEIKAECSDDYTPEPTDQELFKSLLDTWDAVDEGHYSEDNNA